MRIFAFSCHLAWIVLFLAIPVAADEPPLEARALLVPKAEATLASQISATITQLNVEEGDSIRKGQLMVVFDCAIQEAEYAKAKAELELAQVTLDSNKQLDQLASASQLELAIAQANVSKAQAEKRRAEAWLKRCKIRAPFSGRVVEKKVHAHEAVSTGEPLIEILDDSELTIDLLVPSNWLAWLKPEMALTISISETGKQYPAYVSRLGAKVDAVSQTIAIKAKLKQRHKELRAGMSGIATFSMTHE